MTPEEILNLSIGILLGSEDIGFIESNDWITQHAECAKRLDRLCETAAWLEKLTAQLVQTKQSLAQKGLRVEVSLSGASAKFKQVTCRAVKDCLVSAYGIKPSTCDIGAAYFAVLIRDRESNVVSTALADFRPFPDNEFSTRMEAVDKKWQRQRIATELFIFIDSVVRFLTRADGFVRLNMMGCDPSSMVVKSYVDIDAPEWHSTMLEKFGFTEDEGAGWRGDVEFSKVLG
jgi:hypothetical protein